MARLAFTSRSRLHDWIDPARARRWWLNHRHGTDVVALRVPLMPQALSSNAPDCEGRSKYRVCMRYNGSDAFGQLFTIQRVTGYPKRQWPECAPARRVQYATCGNGFNQKIIIYQILLIRAVGHLRSGRSNAPMNLPCHSRKLAILFQRILLPT